MMGTTQVVKIGVIPTSIGPILLQELVQLVMSHASPVVKRLLNIVRETDANQVLKN